jgi:hypothetical protein
MILKWMKLIMLSCPHWQFNHSDQCATLHDLRIYLVLLSTVHCPLAPHAFTGVQDPSPPLGSTCVDTRAKAQPSQRLASVPEDASSTAEALMARHRDARRVMVLSQH